MPLLDAGQLAMLERAHRRIPDGTRLSHELMRAIARLRDRFAIEELAASYAFTGREALTVPKALEVKEELARIDRLLEQIEEALENAKPAIVDLHKGSVMPKKTNASGEYLENFGFARPF